MVILVGWVDILIAILVIITIFVIVSTLLLCFYYFLPLSLPRFA